MDSIWHPGILVSFWTIETLWLLALLAFAIFETIQSHASGTGSLLDGPENVLLVDTGRRFSTAIVYIVLGVVALALDLSGFILFVKVRLSPCVYLTITTVKFVFFSAVVTYQGLWGNGFDLLYVIFVTPILLVVLAQVVYGGFVRVASS
ncbi:Hypothetical protein R9X50_00497200 [Acrodontium crateriforme]|uniref:Uncharacterized protein n=1 Tax=Acrodontium crateriforme TaxID=150365 RepID=A0AAQ3MBY9_9PEZI|nr:Hypothetical protein R9X50_00497200 [Acrodontium crateriforme]